MGHIDVQVVSGHRLDGAVEALDGAEHLFAQGEAHEDRDDHADKGAGQAHGVQKAHGVPVEDLGLPQHQIQPRPLMVGHRIGKLSVAAVQGLPFQEPLAQGGGHAVRQSGLRTVDGPPIGAQNQQIIAGANDALQEAVQVGSAETHQQVADLFPSISGQRYRSLKQGFVRNQGLLRREKA